MTHLHDDFWDDLFHGCAVAAYVEQAILEQHWPPRRGSHPAAGLPLL